MKDAWLVGYTFFNPHVFDVTDHWRANQIIGWVRMYGEHYFDQLEIDWSLLNEGKA